MKPLVYVAGPHTAPSKREVLANVEKAAKAAYQLWARGAAVICPHCNTIFTAMDKPWFKDLGYDVWLNGHFSIIERVDALFLLPEWAASNGARLEVELAQMLNKPCFTTLDEFETWARKRWPTCTSDLPKDLP